MCPVPRVRVAAPQESGTLLAVCPDRETAWGSSVRPPHLAPRTRAASEWHLPHAGENSAACPGSGSLMWEASGGASGEGQEAKGRCSWTGELAPAL